MLLAITVLCGVFLGWTAGREGVLAIVPPAVAVAAALTIAGYLRFLFKNWRKVLGRLSKQGSRTFQREALVTLAWSLVLRILVMGAAGLLAYWISAVFR